MYELINASSLSTVVKETLYTVNGHSNLSSDAIVELTCTALMPEWGVTLPAHTVL